ncbi:MAG TPA: UDP-N-acetylmuramoyl-tripeptide--D-alanyl-D-alanine ligase [Clostridiaceae bacterium]|nr:UDP-N-acetylmuramoyl-tripeptide--D-alanyl-D-alanine ligase [Clostridiaceae bacterium]
MYEIGCSELVDIVKGTLISGDLKSKITGISTDSRKISEGDLFVALTGERFDGHDFIDSVFQKGAVGCIAQKDISPVEGKIIIKVEDTVKALGDIARTIRKKFSVPIIAITGSVGKTSTKEMVASVLGTKYNVLKSRENFNNEIGLPLTLVSLDSFHQIGVVEMGTRNFGDISYLTNICSPDIAIITNIGVSHIERFGSRQNILKAKLEILEGLPPEGTVILNGDDKLLYGLKDLLSFKTKYFGIEEVNDYYAYNITKAGENGTYFDIKLNNKEYRFHIPVPGIHNVYCALAAIAVGMETGMDIESIQAGISQYSPGNMRLNIVSGKGIKIIDDVYNASPQSMEAAIEVLKDISGNARTVAILGDMLEMGDWAFEAHKDIGKLTVQKNIDYVLTVGENARGIFLGALYAGIPEERVYTFESNGEVNEFLNNFVRPGDYLLVKGSRGMKMEEIVNHLLALEPKTQSEVNGF